MKRDYDIIYLTNTPSFYKLNLCEAIAKRGVRILLVFYGYGAEAVNRQMEHGEWSFDYHFLHEGDSHKRNKAKTFLRLCRLMHGIKARMVLYAGWLAPEYNLYSLFSAKKRNVVINESRGEDVGLEGLKGAVKRCVINRMKGALPSGIPQKELFTKLDFKGLIECTGSVGIIRKEPFTPKKNPNYPLRYLYVGRLVSAKNLALLIRVFNRLGLPLTIVGAGTDEAMLKGMAGSNITFQGFVNNDELGEIYQQHDVFILPSNYEPWGLVVEEALYWGLPVIVSEKVGCGPDMVRAYGSGFFFKHDDEESLAVAIGEMQRCYPDVRKKVLAIDWDKRENDQVEAYLKILKSL